MDIDRSEINRALAKAIAYKQCGQEHKAAMWAARLVLMLGAAGILRDEYRILVPHMSGYDEPEGTRT